MKSPYKITDIEWDADVEDVKDLPIVTWIEIDASFDEAVNGAAADFLADRYGFRVKSCKIEEVEKPDPRRVFMVEARRTERYVARMNVLANSKEEAERIMERADRNDSFCDVWNELQPEVETEYVAVPSPRPGQREGVL